MINKTEEYGASKKARAEKLDDFFRRLSWLFSKSGIMFLALEHFLAMIPATIIVPLMVNQRLGITLIDVSLVLLTSGIGTIIFTLISGGKIPAYIGSSFAYIGLTIYLIEEYCSRGSEPIYAYSYVGWAYILSGIILIALSFLYQKKGIEKILSFLLPASIIGPAISLIGLELADTAISDAGFDVINKTTNYRDALVAGITLAIIVLFSLTKHKRIKNAAIVVGMFLGTCVYYMLNGLPHLDIDKIQWFSIPKLTFPLATIPDNLIGLFFAILPATFVVFTENVGRVTVINRMVNEQDKNDTVFNPNSVGVFRKALLSHGIASVTASVIGSVPNTIYAENIAVMSIHNSRTSREEPDPVIRSFLEPYSVVPYILAALLAIVFSFIGVLQTVILGIPKPVIGGMEMFLFGIISAPGIQLLVEQRVNYKRVSNQIVTAAVLISGISGLSVNLGVVELKGMGLGFVVGVVLNLIVQGLKWLGNISDILSYDEILVECLSSIVHKDDFNVRHSSFPNSQMSVNECYTAIQFDQGQYDVHRALISDLLRNPSIDIQYSNSNTPFMKIMKTANDIIIELQENIIDKDTKNKYLNDYNDSIDIYNNSLRICVTDIPMRKVHKIIKLAEYNVIHNAITDNLLKLN